jgi:hypothetical protein
MKDENPSVHPSSFSPQPSPSSDEEEDDALPAVGKVWDNSGPSLSELLKARQSEEPAPAPAPAREPEASNVEPVSSTDLPAMWQRLLEVLEARGPALHSLVVHGKLTAIDNDRAVISYDKKHQTFVKLLDRNGKKDVVRDALSQVAGRPLGVHFDVDSSASDEAEPAAASTAVMERPVARQQPVKREVVRVPVEPPLPAAPAPAAIRITPELKESLRNSEPLIKSLMDELGADIVKVESPES